MLLSHVDNKLVTSWVTVSNTVSNDNASWEALPQGLHPQTDPPSCSCAPKDRIGTDWGAGEVTFPNCDMISLTVACHGLGHFRNKPWRRRRGLFGARLRYGKGLLRELRAWARPACVWSTSTGSKYFLQEVIFSALELGGPKLSRNDEQRQIPVCIEIPIVMDCDKWHAVLGVFSSL